MSDEDQESTEGVENEGEAVVEEKPKAKSAPKPKATIEEDDDSDVTMSLEELNNVEVLKGMITRLRHENGNHRKKNQALAEEAAKLEAWKINHNKTIDEAKAEVSRYRAIAKNYAIKDAAREYNVDEDLIDLIDGETEEEIWAKAQKLQNTKKRKASYEEASDALELFSGRRGKPIEPPKKDPGADWLKDVMGGNFGGR